MADTLISEGDSISSRHRNPQGRRSDGLKTDPMGDQMGQPLGSLLGALQGDLMEQGVFVEGDDPRTVCPKGCVSLAQDTAKLDQLRS